MLLDSLDTDLLGQMYENCDESDSFISYWMNLMSIIGSISIERFMKIKETLKARKIQSYPGEDVEAIASGYTADWKKVHSARMYDHSLTLIMLKMIMEAANEDFRSAEQDGFRIIGASASSPPDSDIPVYDLDKLPINKDANGPPTLLVLGSEGHGIRSLVASTCTEFVKIPGAADQDSVDSLNVSVTGGILM